MAYRRKYYKRKRQRWTPYWKRPLTVGKSTKRRSGASIGVEYKFIDYSLGSTAISATLAGSEQDPGGAVLSLSAIAQGDGESNRDGRKCILKSIFLKGAITLDVLQDQADVVDAGPVRVVVCLDTQTNGAQFNAEDVLDDGATTETLAFRDLQYTSRFKILFDRRFVLDYGNVGTDGANTLSVGGKAVQFKVFRKLDIPVNFTGAAAEVASIQDNSLHIFAFGNSTANLAYESRVRFVG